ncbi:hypothetical protein HMPREF9439_01988 [Parasutterella excrementihominis YIT 11859]|uniref:Uncharacterized protein n=1 Tax=Parasutterella excrementihominis YIT 11859 TaxID=762966 RepID=F3QM13_9BURK|nr:hypothetical protein HMPREF9439_01988 [Parasutterella excrementihominis YIT 11859]
MSDGFHIGNFSVEGAVEERNAAFVVRQCQQINQRKLSPEPALFHLCRHTSPVVPPP